MANFSHFLLKIVKNVYEGLTSYPQYAIVGVQFERERTPPLGSKQWQNGRVCI